MHEDVILSAWEDILQFFSKWSKFCNFVKSRTCYRNFKSELIHEDEIVVWNDNIARILQMIQIIQL